MPEHATQTPTDAVRALAQAREAATAKAKADRDRANADANRAFATGVRAVVDAGEMTVAEIAAAIGIGRIRLYEILRQYGQTDS